MKNQASNVTIVINSDIMLLNVEPLVEIKSKRKLNMLKKGAKKMVSCYCLTRTKIGAKIINGTLTVEQVIIYVKKEPCPWSLMNY